MPQMSLLYGARDCRVPNICINFYKKISPNNHWLQFKMFLVRRYDSSSTCNLCPNKFRVHILPCSTVQHLLCHNAPFSIVHLSKSCITSCLPP
ncbi:hypothetical protein KP509_16G033700 [Ceratopteris richardii]|uniref:Uncharacterized protein n=1 Tax=Ceratopteris richardii TaxID=49495 RepID=A0A8T2SZ93_CERRI|nr:hypothetical protein KP509_16G033700 [Ceratopteris richardii]